MKSTNYQKNEILFIGKVKLIINHPTRKDQFTKISRVLTIDLMNGGLLYDCAQFSFNSANRTNIENKKASIEKLETPSSIFQIQPENQIHQCNGDSIDIYLNKLGIIKDKTEVISFYCNNRENYMMPIIFESKSVRTRFHIGILVFQLYNKYIQLFLKYQEIKNLHTKMNMKLLQSVALSIATKDFVIDPQVCSVVQLEHFELKIIKQAIQHLSIKTMNISKSSGRLNDDNLFSLRLRYKIVDIISLNYFYEIVPQQIFRRNVHQFDINGCGVSDKILPSILLKQENKMSSIPIMRTETLQFQNLIRLDLSNNDLTDFCFLTLGQFVAYTPKLSDLCLSNNRIKLQTISSLKKQNVTIPKIASQASLLAPQSQNIAQEPFFIQFLLSLRYLPLNYLNLDKNQIQETEILVEYIIEGSNVPLRYLSIKNNKINEVDKIRMAKLIISQVTDRAETQLMPVIDFGYICVIDEQVYRYIVLLKEKTDELQLQNVIDSRKTIEQPIQSRRSTKKISSFSLFDLRKSERSTAGIINVSITSNKDWQICDQGGILQVSNLYRNRVKTTTRRRSQFMIQNMLIGNTLTPSNSQSSLKVDSKNFEQVILNSETLKPAVKLLRQAYITSNYSAIQFYKEQLIDYNEDLYNKKIAPIFLNYEKIIKKEKMKILSELQQFINFSSSDRRKNSILLSSKHIQNLIMSNYSQENINDKLNSIISKFFRKRIDYNFNQEIILYEGELDEETMPGKGHCWNVFTFLLFLKLKRDQLIQRYILENYNPYEEIHQKLKYEKNLYKNYYQTLSDWICQDNYYSKLLQIVTEDHEKESEQEFKKRKEEERKNMEQKMKSKKWGEKNINELIRDKFLQKCKYNVQSQVINRNNKQTLVELSVNKQEQFLCSVEPKLLFTGYLIKYYNNVNETNHISMIPKLICNLGINNPILSEPISHNIKNFLDYVSKYDLLTSSSLAQCTCINPNLSVDVLSSYEDIKLAMYNGNYEESLKKFSSLVIAFLKFFYHSPYAVLPQTLQYLNYLINIILLEKDRYNVQSLSTQFYLQLLTYNVSPDPQLRAAQIHPKILATLIQFCSMYLVHAENLEPYIISHILRMEIVTNNSINKNSMCRMVRHNIHRYNKTEDQLPPDIVSYIFDNIGTQDKYFLGIPVDIHYYSREDNNELEQNKLEKLTLKMHILSTIPEIMSEIASSGICKDFEFPMPKQQINGNENKRFQQARKLIKCNTNWGLFLYSNETQKLSLLLPNSQQILNLYSLLKKQILTLPTKISKYILIVKQLISPLEYPLFKSYNYSEYENLANKKQKWASTIKQVQSWYIRIYRGFRDYGGCLTMMQVAQKNVYLVDIIVECVLCFMLTKNANRIIQMTTLNVRKQKQFLTALCKANVENLEYFCPKGASYTLSNQQKTHVYEECLKQLSLILTEVTIQPQQNQIQTYDQFLFKNMVKFHEDCKFITDCTVLIDPYGHQEVLFNNYGLVWVDRIIYVQAVLWRFVYNITVVVEKRDQQNQIKSIVIEWLAKERQNERYSQNVKRRDKTKQLRINSSGNKDSSIFMNSCLVMIKNIGLRYIRYENSTLYRLISASNVGQYRESINILQNQESAQEKMDRQSMKKEEGKIYSIWQQIISTIYYKQIRKNVDEEKKESTDPIKNNNQAQNSTAHQNNENEEENMNRFFKSKINNNLSAYLQNKRKQIVNDEENSPIPEPQERKISDDINNYELESHKSQIPSNSIISSGSGIEHVGRQQKNAEEIIVTNARKSGKRELPKRRSSRDK